jgi:16S rRNA (cytidine1402-2'-O)-methyltransferase
MNSPEGILYVVATPIGNLEDITLRALRVLREVDVIYSEDTRETRVLLAHYSIPTPLKSHLGGKSRKIREILAHLDAGRAVAIVSDRGMPGISDPGEAIVRAAIESGHQVVVIPGANAAITALVASGLPTERFVFEGFLPKAGTARAERLERLRFERRTMVFHESPARFVQLLADLSDALGKERPAACARELTKMHEEIVRGTLGTLLDHFLSHRPRGELILIVAGTTEQETPTLEDAYALLEAAIASGTPVSEAVKSVAHATGIPRNTLYEHALKVSGRTPETREP